MIVYINKSLHLGLQANIPNRYMLIEPCIIQNCSPCLLHNKLKRLVKGIHVELEAHTDQLNMLLILVKVPICFYHVPILTKT